MYPFHQLRYLSHKKVNEITSLLYLYDVDEVNYKHGLGNEVRRLFEDAIAPKIIPLRASFDKECFAKYIHFLSNYIHLYYKLCIVFTPPITYLCIFFVTFCVCVCVTIIF